MQWQKHSIQNRHLNPFIHSITHLITHFYCFPSVLHWKFDEFFFIHPFICALLLISIFFGRFIDLSMPVNVWLHNRFTTFSCSFSTHNLNDASTDANYHHPYTCFDTALITSPIDCFDPVKCIRNGDRKTINYVIHSLILWGCPKMIVNFKPRATNRKKSCSKF